MTRRGASMNGLAAVIAACLLGFALPLAALAAQSVYTDVDTDHCTTVAQLGEDDGPGDLISLKCKGYREYPLYYAESDMRQSVHFGYLDQEIIDQGFETFGPFNHINRKVEWRLDDGGKPFATILRYFVENYNPDTGNVDDKHLGQVLVISRVGQPSDKRGCVVGYVDALKNSEPNEMARKVADEMAASFVCGKDRPAFHGVRTDPGNDPAYNFPELKK
jgi:hypothetical protein